MSINFFGPRDRFDFSRDSLDIGNTINWYRDHFLKHLFKKLFALLEHWLEGFYGHHLAYYLEKHPQEEEPIFFNSYIFKR